LPIRVKKTLTPIKSNKKRKDTYTIVDQRRGLIQRMCASRSSSARLPKLIVTRAPADWAVHVRILTDFFLSFSCLVFHCQLFTVQFFSRLNSTSSFFSFGIAGSWEMKRAKRWFDIHMEVKVLFLNFHIRSIILYTGWNNSTDTEKLKLVIVKKTRKKSTSYLSTYK
jgi:hypothetical protein